MTSFKLNSRSIFKIFGFAFAIIFIVGCVWLFRLNSKIQKRLEQGWFKPPIEIYARGEQIRPGNEFAKDHMLKVLARFRYRERFEGQSLMPHDYANLDKQQCQEVLKSLATPKEDIDDTEVHSCLYLRTPEHEWGPQRQAQTVLIVFSAVGQSYGTTQNLIEDLAWGALRVDAVFTNGERQDRFEFAPQLFAQFYDNEPILRTVIRVGDAPLECLQAVTAIEDSHFLEHKGISFTGLARAFIQNILTGRYAQGGSTITQQLVKNYFLTSEKTLRRKFVELFMALLLELNTNKDQILENYMNVAYMGQRGPFQVIGMGSASEFYYNKPLQNLNLGECALLAAIINNPKKYNPTSNPENATQRRNFVLERMVQNNMITEDQALKAKEQPLPQQTERLLIEPAPYFTQAVFRELKRLGLNQESGLRVFSTLDVTAQDLAQKYVRAHVDQLEKNYKKLAANKAAGRSLESSLISVDVESGDVIALVGGRQYVKTQYNRVLDAHRQIGSIMKPFVYLAALESRDSTGEPYTATTLIDDAKFTYRYEGQSWSPQNYEKEFYGRVPLFFALKSSLNAATAQLGLQVGLGSVIDVARRAGFVSELKEFPSLTLGAFEIYPWEVATGYLTLARMGQRLPLSFIRSVENLNGIVIYESESQSEPVFAAENVAVLLGMMKQTLKTGTARYANTLGFVKPAAGKTGTTSDTKDTWFAGFTPHLLTVTWAGYDNNDPTGLTGASGALPLWVQFMKDVTPRDGSSDFNWPEGVEKFALTPSELLTLTSRLSPVDTRSAVELIRKK